MREYLKYAIMFSRLALLFSAILVTDYTLPPKKTKEEVLSIKPNEARGYRSSALALQDGEVINMKQETALQFQSGTVIALYSSSWFSVPLMPFVMLLTSLVGTFWWKGIEFRFNLGVVNGVLILLNLIFLQIHSF